MDVYPFKEMERTWVERLKLRNSKSRRLYLSSNIDKPSTNKIKEKKDIRTVNDDNCNGQCSFCSYVFRSFFSSTTPHKIFLILKR